MPGNVLIRTKLDPLQVLAGVRSAIRTVDKDMPLTRIATMEQRLSRALAPRRFNFVLIGTFSALAFLLAAFGIYGIVAYNTTRRIHEIGVRMALGAKQQDILQMILREGALLFALGEGLGLVAAFALNRMIASMLFRITPTDPSTYAGVSLLWAAVVFLACYIPAWRAARVDPMAALRRE
jgi:ABC-type antimicrobial peptide transport system permease subunit